VRIERNHWSKASSISGWRHCLLLLLSKLAAVFTEASISFLLLIKPARVPCEIPCFFSTHARLAPPSSSFNISYFSERVKRLRFSPLAGMMTATNTKQHLRSSLYKQLIWKEVATDMECDLYTRALERRKPPVTVAFIGGMH